MTDAREVIARFWYGQEVGGSMDDGYDYDKERAYDFADRELAALSAAGLKLVDKSKFKAKLNAKSMKYLDDMAEAEEAMDSKPALKILLAHYRAMVEAASDE